MPCYLTQSISVDLGSIEPRFIISALAALGFEVRQSGTVTFFTGTIEGREIRGGVKEGTVRYETEEGFDAISITNAIKREVTKSVVKAAASQYRWGIEQAAPGKLKLTKGGF